ncbi:hypothetical protein QZH41_011394 [Actinostola sp. cb2023]|nr:hypothetical protein QZH41_011394 [Actinostola sp. cb2023]
MLPQSPHLSSLSPPLVFPQSLFCGHAPLRAFYLVWTYILGPWFFAEAPDAEIDPKKQKKMERKMKRSGMMQ